MASLQQENPLCRFGVPFLVYAYVSDNFGLGLGKECQKSDSSEFSNSNTTMKNTLVIESKYRPSVLPLLKIIEYFVQLILLNSYSKFYQLEYIIWQDTVVIVFPFCTTKHLLRSTNFVQDRNSKIRSLLPIVLNPIQFGGIAHDNKQNSKLFKYSLWAAIPFKEKYLGVSCVNVDSNFRTGWLNIGI